MIKIIYFVLLLWSSVVVAELTVDHDLALKIGVKIWYNEGGGRVSSLTAWGKGESFASLGIGHFIWYPAQEKPIYGESFSNLLHYFAQRGVNLPSWLRDDIGRYCFWSNREAFRRDFHSPRMVALRQLLLETVPLQAQYMVMRLKQALPRIIRAVPDRERVLVRQLFHRVMATPKGLFALIDYVNFKGEGLGHGGRNWGLYHVVMRMRKAPSNLTALESFVWAADVVLTRRVHNAPKGSHDSRWLSGWRKRIYGYL